MSSTDDGIGTDEIETLWVTLTGSFSGTLKISVYPLKRLLLNKLYLVINYHIYYLFFFN